MIEVEMSKDIRDTPPKIIGPFTKRQLICVGIAAAYGVPVFLLLKNVGVQVILSIVIAIILMAPAIACGWVSLFGVPLEKFMLHIAKTMLLTPGKRKYQTENTYLAFMPEPEPAVPVKKNKKGGGKAKAQAAPKQKAAAANTTKKQKEKKKKSGK